MGYEYLDHPGDVGIRAWGETLEEAFLDAGRAVFALMADPENVAPTARREVRVEAQTLDGLLVEWIAALLAEKDLSGLIFSDFEVSIEGERTGYRLTGAALGEPPDPKRHRIGTEVKGISYLGLAVREADRGWIVEFIADV